MYKGVNYINHAYQEKKKKIICIGATMNDVLGPYLDKYISSFY